MNTPKFKKGDWIKRKKDGRIAQVVMLLKTCYDLRLADGDGWWLDYDYQDNWELTATPPKNKLDEAAKVYALNTAEDSEQYSARYLGYKDGAKWQKEQDDKELSEKIAAAYQLGVKDKAQKLVEGLEEAAEDFAHGYDNGTCDGVAQDCFKAGAEWAFGQFESMGTFPVEDARGGYWPTEYFVRKK